MGVIKITHAGQATAEEVALMQGQAVQNVDNLAGKSAAAIQPKAAPKYHAGQRVKDIAPKELTEGKVATAKEVVHQAMDNKGTYYDLISDCVDTLRAMGAHPNQIDAMLNSALIREAKGRTTFAQRTALNSFWSNAIGQMGVAGMRYRQNLINTGTATDWIRFFQNGTAQFIVQFSLPVGCGAPVDKKLRSS